MGLPGPMVGVYLSFKETTNYDPVWAVPFYSLIAKDESLFFYILDNTWNSLLNISYSYCN